jgi:hypothetical protein
MGEGAGWGLVSAVPGYILSFILFCKCGMDAYSMDKPGSWGFYCTVADMICTTIGLASDAWPLMAVGGLTMIIGWILTGIALGQAC